MASPRFNWRAVILRGCTPLALLLVGGGCMSHSSCPQAQAAGAGPAAQEPLFISGEDPFERGSLAVAAIELPPCEPHSPVPLLILAPQGPGNYPVVVFQHAFVTQNAAYRELLSHVASHGFVVVAPQMYEPGLAALLGEPTAAQEAQAAAQLLKGLPDILAGALGYSPASRRLGLAGHSRGGKVAWLMLRADPALAQAVAGVDPVDGRGGPRGNQPRVADSPFQLGLPTLVIGAGRAGDCAPAGDNYEQFYEASSSPAWQVVIAEAGHADMLDEQTAALARRVCGGHSDRAAVRRLIGGLLVAFFRGSLQGDSSAYAYLEQPAAGPLTVLSVAK